MMRSIWMNAWDLEGREPERVLDRLQEYGLDACNLGLSCHGGRIVLPTHPRRAVYEQHPGALYHLADLKRYRNSRLRPHVAPLSALVDDFISTCEKRKWPVNAWTVLCHDDYLGGLAEDCCIHNVFGDSYTYALCPSNAEVRQYIVTLCQEISEIPGVSGLDLEALSFMGYEHSSLHEKRGLPLAPEIIWLLSICVCDFCMDALGRTGEEIAHKARSAVRAYFNDLRGAEPVDLPVWLKRVLGEEALDALLEMRRAKILSLLREICGVAKGKPVSVRFSPDPLFQGDKTALAWDDVKKAVDAVTLTFFGAGADDMAAQLRGIPRPNERPVPVYGGFVFHHPDCQSEQTFRDRLALVEEAGLDGVIFYSLSMATGMHLDWLKRAPRAPAA